MSPSLFAAGRSGSGSIDSSSLAYWMVDSHLVRMRYRCDSADAALLSKCIGLMACDLKAWSFPSRSSRPCAVDSPGFLCRPGSLQSCLSP